MSRLMSVALTEAAVVARTKTVTRRLGWRFLKPGDHLTLVRKSQGRKPGEPLIRLAEVEVVSVERVKLCLSFLGRPDDIEREGVPAERWYLDDSGFPTNADQWIGWFCEEMGVDPDAEVTRIEWRYIEDGPA